MKRALYRVGQVLRKERWLALLAVVGMLLYFALMPSQHPHSTIRYQIDDEGAKEAVRSFARHSGYSVPEQMRGWSHLEEGPLADSLQRAWGRPEFVRFLRSHGPRVPAYRWSVVDKEGEETVWSAELNLAGEVVAFDPRLPTAARTVVRGALQNVLEGGEGSVRLLPDSVIAASARFDLNGRPEARAAGPGDALRLDAEAAASIAVWHLGRTAYAEAPLTLEEVVPAEAGSGATVRFAGTLGEGRVPVRLAVDVMPTGVLLELTPTFVAPRDGLAPGDIYDFMAMGAIALLMLITLVILVRRIQARVVDPNAALRDALLGCLFAATAYVAIQFGPVGGMMSADLWMRIFFAIVNALIVGGGGAFIIFLASMSMDSVARPVWPSRLRAYDFFRQGRWLNGTVGRSLLRGVLGTGVLCGVLTLLLVLWPALPVSTLGGITTWIVGSPLIVAAGVSAWWGLAIGFIVLLGMGALLHQRGVRGWMLVLALGLICGFVNLDPVSISSLPGAMVSSGLVGVAWAWLFVRYGLLASLTSYTLTGVFFFTAEGWMVPASPIGTDVALLGGLILALLALAFVGLLRGARDGTVEEYVPSYIRELAREERMQRELELAREVQSSFLPRSMPKVEGWDIAARCEPAYEVGGDYYDLIRLPDDRLAVVVADVSGKGMRASFYMTLAKGFWQALATDTDSPREVMVRFNDLFCRQVQRGTFISVLYGILDVDEGTFTYVRAGHNPVAYRSGPHEQPRWMRPEGMAVGLTADERFAAELEEQTLDLHPGGMVVLYTDGFPEAMNAENEEYGARRLLRRLGEDAEASADDLLDEVLADVEEFAGGAVQHDDMTMLVLRYTGVEVSGNEEQAKPAPAREPHST